MATKETFLLSLAFARNVSRTKSVNMKRNYNIASICKHLLISGDTMRNELVYCSRLHLYLRADFLLAQAQSKIKILEKLPPLIAPAKDEMEGLGEGDASIYFSFPAPEKLSPPILQMEDVTFAYSDRIILKDINFDLQMDSKIAVVGPNGAGKSTLIKVLTEDVRPQRGLVKRHGRLRVALFSQHHVDQLELGMSIVFLSASC